VRGRYEDIAPVIVSHAYAFDICKSGTFRISLPYDALSGTGKTTAHADTVDAA
jgi:hypothetical protein